MGTAPVSVGVAMSAGGRVSGKSVRYLESAAQGIENAVADAPAGWPSGKSRVRGVEGASGAVSLERRWNQRARLEEHWSA